MLCLLNGLAVTTAGFAVIGCAQLVIGATLVVRFKQKARQTAPSTGQTNLSPVTVLKPLHGSEPLLDIALESFCKQDYPEFQIVFGIQRPNDPAIQVVKKLQKKYPHLALDLVIDSTAHGINRKIANLINMLAFAKHPILVISDSDIHAPKDYLRKVVLKLSEPGTGLVSTLYAGRPATPSLIRQAAASQINHNFMPGVLMSRVLNRQDCLGATMALQASTLNAIGGLHVLADDVADDALLGQKIRASGDAIHLADCLTWTTTAESSLSDLILHEVRWGRTVRSLEPVGYGLSAIQLPLFWATITLISLPELKTWMFFLIVWFIRAATAAFIDRQVCTRSWALYGLFPLRDWLSAFIMVGSAWGQRVDWRGETLHLQRPPQDKTPST